MARAVKREKEFLPLPVQNDMRKIIALMYDMEQGAKNRAQCCFVKHFQFRYAHHPSPAGRLFHLHPSRFKNASIFSMLALNSSMLYA